jgi:RNA polymerase sigma factor (sigma-70 family)
MLTATATSSTPRALDSERAYLAQLGAAPRFDRSHETERARAVVRTRRAYWAVLLSPSRLDGVLDAIVGAAKDVAIATQAAELRAGLEAGLEAENIERGREALASALDRRGDEHAAADAIVALAASVDAGWHAQAVRARTAFLAARNRFVAANLRLVLAFAHRYGAHLLPLVDRIQEGNIGLVKAVDRFDPERGIRFSTYACWWIRHTILRALSNDGRTVRVPWQVQGLHAKLEHARRRLGHELGREPDRAELAAAAGCTVEQLERVALAMQLQPAGGHARQDAEGREWDTFDALDDETALAAIEHAADAADRARAIAALRDLPAREQGILHERYGFVDGSSGTFRELGQRHGVSRERVRQIHSGALELLRRKLVPRSERGLALR